MLANDYKITAFKWEGLYTKSGNGLVKGEKKKNLTDEFFAPWKEYRTEVRFRRNERFGEYQYDIHSKSINRYFLDLFSSNTFERDLDEEEKIAETIRGEK